MEAYAPYRRTHDVDVLVRQRDFPALKACLVEQGLAHRRTHLAKHTFKGRKAGEVDAYTDRVGDVTADEGWFRRARTLIYGGFAIRVVSLEDLLLLKLSAAREMDLADVAVLLHGRRDELDVGLVEKLVGLKLLRRSGPLISERLPEEYGGQARQRLKVWLREQGWYAPKSPRRP